MLQVSQQEATAPSRVRDCRREDADGPGFHGQSTPAAHAPSGFPGILILGMHDCLRTCCYDEDDKLSNHYSNWELPITKWMEPLASRKQDEVVLASVLAGVCKTDLAGNCAYSSVHTTKEMKHVSMILEIFLVARPLQANV